MKCTVKIRLNLPKSSSKKGALLTAPNQHTTRNGVAFVQLQVTVYSTVAGTVWFGSQCTLYTWWLVGCNDVRRQKCQMKTVTLKHDRMRRCQLN